MTRTHTPYGQEGNSLESLAKAHLAVDAAADRQADDIILLDINHVSSFADYFVICSGSSTRQLNAIVDTVEKTIADAGEKVSHREGAADSGWVLLDYGDVIIHVFAPDERHRYQLEKLWADGTVVVRLQ